MSEVTYKRADFVNDTEVRWCPGCGDYAILAALQRTLPELGLPPEQHVFISGIGCAGRLPYYMNTYGFHTIHGRALTVATGLKTMRPDLCVWVITGDGDALSIGTNHLIHALRRNVNVKILLVNNQVYGLTKGQISPTSQAGQVTKTSPEGVAQQPLNPLTLALSAGAGFVARAVDKDPNHLSEMIKAAYEYPGAAFLEIYQDCNIFNHGAFDAFSLKEHRAHKTVVLKDGQPFLYGVNNEYGLTVDAKGTFQCVGQDAVGQHRHDVRDKMAAMRLAQLTFPDYPVPLGVYYCEPRETFSTQGTFEKTIDDLPALFRTKASWHS